MYDLIVKNGTVVDPENHIRGRFDIGVADGAVAEIAEEIGPDRGKRVLNVFGKTAVDEDEFEKAVYLLFNDGLE